MNALIAGGTREFGTAVTHAIAQREYQTFTVARKNADFNCDLSSSFDWSNVLEEIKKRIDSIDLLACIVGYARHTDASTQNTACEQIDKHIQLNYNYVLQTIDQLHDPSRTKTITIGSKWGIRHLLEGSQHIPKALQPYALAKSKLASRVAQLSNTLDISHYAVPSMQTEGCKAVTDSFAKKGLSVPNQNFAYIPVVAQNMIEHALMNQKNGVYNIDSNGKISCVDVINLKG